MIVLPSLILIGCLLSWRAGIDPAPLLVQIALLWAGFGVLAGKVKREERKQGRVRV